MRNEEKEREKDIRERKIRRIIKQKNILKESNIKARKRREIGDIKERRNKNINEYIRKVIN